MSAPPRHTLVWLDPAGRRHLRRTAPAPVADWTETDLPLVCRRSTPDDPAGTWPLALALPPSPTGARSRFAVTIPADAVSRHAPPPTLRTLLDAGTLPATWHPRARILLTLAHRHGMEPRVFGAACWQHLSGLPYLHPRSDLDLLWPAAELAGTGLPSLLASLSALPDDLPPRLDGEILFPDGSGVQWRELAAAIPDTPVLLKTAATVRLVPAATLLPPHPDVTAPLPPRHGDAVAMTAQAEDVPGTCRPGTALTAAGSPP